jgi:hypothetical protein
LKNLNYDIEIIKFLLKPYPSYIIIPTKSKITLIRRYNNDSKIEGIILYKDNLYETQLEEKISSPEPIILSNRTRTNCSLQNLNKKSEDSDKKY